VLEQQQLLPLVEHLASVGRRAFETSIPPDGLRRRHLIVLKLLSEHGPASQQGARGSAEPDPSSVVGLLNELEERQLITRCRDRSDRRRHIVELSPRSEDELHLACAQLSLVEDDLQRPQRRGEAHPLRPARPRYRGEIARVRRCRRTTPQPRLIQYFLCQRG
jgi:MarR family transcriptional regulator, transcriptional regulator for hemolysin